MGEPAAAPSAFDLDPAPLVDPSAMALPPPFAGADDATVVDGCLQEDPDAWEALRARWGTLLYATIVRATDAPRAAELDHEALLELVWEHLGADGAAALRQWTGECQLRSYLAIVGRHLALVHAEVSTSPATLVAALPTPSGLFLDDLLAIEPARRVAETLEKLPPNIDALVRLRLRGLSRDDVAATLGMSPATVLANLERVARRLGELDAGEAGSGATWRALLDAATVEERVAQALRTEDDADFRAARALVEKTWRAVGERALGRPAPRDVSCLDDRSVAGFVDGTLRGPGRARAEGHVATCPRCIDEAAALVLDLRAVSVLREAAELGEAAAVAAACVATTRFAAAERLSTRALERSPGSRVVAGVRRLAQAGQLLEGGRRREQQTSQVVPTHVPDDDEAPLVAFEALVLSDVHAAWRAIDDHMAKHPVGARLRLLAAAAGQDLEAAQALAAAALAQPSVDPGRARDARAVAALPKGRALPREILVEHLRALLPEAVRFVLARPS